MSTTLESPVSPTTLPAAAQAFEQLVLHRRATPEFIDEPVPQADIDQALRFAAEAPSGYNFQPWRFVLLRDVTRRERLRAAAFDQAKITQAPLVIVATADRESWQEEIDFILRDRAARTGRESDQEKAKQSALGFINGLPREIWLMRQVMISFTYLMLGFESLGWNTAPMEGFDPAKVRQALQFPSSTEVIALLAVGRRKGSALLHPGRLPVERIARAETIGTPWSPEPREAGNPAHPPGA